MISVSPLVEAFASYKLDIGLKTFEFGWLLLATTLNDGNSLLSLMDLTQGLMFK